MKRRILKNFNAFSLAEVMIALIIVAILMAASAPLVNRKASLDSNFQCYWSNTTNGIYFNDKGTGQVGIGVQPTSANGLHIKSSTEAAQINFYDKDSTDVSNVLGLYNNNIILGSTENVSSTGNLVIGHAATDFAANGNTLVIGSRDTTLTPILYGKFNSTLSSQILKVNGQLQVGQNTSLDNSNTTYSLIVDENGIYSSGAIVIKDSSGNSYGISNTGAVDASSIRSNGDIMASGTITGGSIVSNGDIKASGTITGNSIVSNNGITASGTIDVHREGNIELYGGGHIKLYGGGNIDVYGGGGITASGNIEAQGLGESLHNVIQAMIDNSASDEKLKNDIIDTDLGLDVVRKINVKQYKFKDEKKYGKGLRYGVIAQEIQKILPNVVEENKDGFLTIRPNDIFFVAINAIKELDKELQYIKHLLNIDELKLDCSKLSAFKIVAKLNKLYDENVELKNEIKLLKEQNQSLEKRLQIIEKQLQSDK